jgi:hypothetical protein
MECGSSSGISLILFTDFLSILTARITINTKKQKKKRKVMLGSNPTFSIDESIF